MHRNDKHDTALQHLSTVSEEMDNEEEKKEAVTSRVMPPPLPKRPPNSYHPRSYATGKTLISNNSSGHFTTPPAVIIHPSPSAAKKAEVETPPLPNRHYKSPHDEDTRQRSNKTAEVDPPSWTVDNPLQLEFQHINVTIPEQEITQQSNTQKIMKQVNKIKSLCSSQHNSSNRHESNQTEMKEISQQQQQQSSNTAATSTSPRQFDPRSSYSLNSPVSQSSPSSASINSHSSSRHILRDVSGFASPGELMAIMGSSGSGKTTLLNVLAGRLRVRNKMSLSGELKLNGQVVNSSLLSCVSAYVMQEDVLMPVMTAREHIQWSADMRLPRKDKHTAELHAAKTCAILKELGLLYCADVPVGVSAAGDGGGAGAASSQGNVTAGNGCLASFQKLLTSNQRGLSGGEQKRVSIGIELVTDPLLLFVDEPTSGLDSSTSFTIMKLLKALALKGRTVICTIHSPSAKIFSLFDRLMLLTPMGEVAYLGAASQALPYFERLGHICPIMTTAADFFLDLLHISNEQDQKEVHRIASIYQEQPDQPMIQYSSKQKITGLSKSSTSHSFSHQLFMLTTRSWWQYIRQPVNILARVLENCRKSNKQERTRIRAYT